MASAFHDRQRDTWTADYRPPNAAPRVRKLMRIPGLKGDTPESRELAVDLAKRCDELARALEGSPSQEQIQEALSLGVIDEGWAEEKRGWPTPAPRSPFGPGGIDDRNNRKDREMGNLSQSTFAQLRIGECYMRGADKWVKTGARSAMRQDGSTNPNVGRQLVVRRGWDDAPHVDCGEPDAEELDHLGRMFEIDEEAKALTNCAAESIAAMAQIGRHCERFRSLMVANRMDAPDALTMALEIKASAEDMRAAALEAMSVYDERRRRRGLEPRYELQIAEQGGLPAPDPDDDFHGGSIAAARLGDQPPSAPPIPPAGPPTKTLRTRGPFQFNAVPVGSFFIQHVHPIIYFKKSPTEAADESGRSKFISEAGLVYVVDPSERVVECPAQTGGFGSPI